jgi:hypothetical protein
MLNERSEMKHPVRPSAESTVVICFQIFINLVLTQQFPSHVIRSMVVICFQIFINLVLTQQRAFSGRKGGVVICFQIFINLVLTQRIWGSSKNSYCCDLLSNFY